MITQKEIYKNTKDLQYSRLLNKLNIILVFISGLIISIIFSEIGLPFSKIDASLLLTIVAVAIYGNFEERLDKMEYETESLY